MRGLSVMEDALNGAFLSAVARFCCRDPSVALVGGTASQQAHNMSYLLYLPSVEGHASDFAVKDAHRFPTELIVALATSVSALFSPRAVAQRPAKATVSGRCSSTDDDVV